MTKNETFINNGFIQLHRDILEWEWYKNINTKTLFIHCILKANFQEKKWQGIIIPRGSFVTSYENLAKETGLTIQNVRTAINKLKSTSELTSKKALNCQVVSITYYDKYQSTNNQTNRRLTDDQQTTNRRLTTTNNDNKENNDNNDNNIEKINKKENLDFIPDDFKPIYQEWLNYRMEIKKPLKETSIKANYNQLMKLANDNFDVAKEIINQSIANGYQGLFEIKKKVSYSQKGNQSGYDCQYGSDIPL